MKVVDNIQYQDFETVVKVTKEVEEFLSKNKINLKLSSRISDHKYWYENLLFKHTNDKTQKKFELIYCGIIEKPEEYESVENIIEKLKLKKKDVIFDGSLTLIEFKNTFVRWLVIKV